MPTNVEEGLRKYAHAVLERVHSMENQATKKHIDGTEVKSE